MARCDSPQACFSRSITRKRLIGSLVAAMPWLPPQNEATVIEPLSMSDRDGRNHPSRCSEIRTYRQSPEITTLGGIRGRDIQDGGIAGPVPSPVRGDDGRRARDMFILGDLCGRTRECVEYDAGEFRFKRWPR